MPEEQSFTPNATDGGAGMPPVDGPHLRWLAIGRTYDPNNPDHPVVKQQIPVMEMARSVSEDQDIDPETHRREPYGQPIDAPLAGRLISNLLNSLRRCGIMHALLEYDEQLNLKANAERLGDAEALKVQQDTAREAAIDAVEKIHHRTGMQWLIQLLLRSHAITFDKSALLKIIGQPKCEGVRFYLCLRPHTHKPDAREIHSDVNPFAPLPDGYLSLVLVGVDEKGNDLGYPGPIDQNNQKPNLATLANASALDEYGHPPGSGFQSGPQTEDGRSAYTLWTYTFDNVLADNFQ